MEAALLNDGEYIHASDGDGFETLVQEYMHQSNYATLSDASFLLINAIMSPAIVALPFIVARIGVLLFLLFLLILAYFTVFTARILIKISDRQGKTTLEELGEAAFGFRGYFLMGWLGLLVSFFSNTASLTIVGAALSTVLKNFFNYHAAADGNRTYDFLFDPRFITFISGLVMFPFCLFRVLTSVLLPSKLSVVFAISSTVLIVIAFIIALFIGHQADSHTTNEHGTDDDDASYHFRRDEDMFPEYRNGTTIIPALCIFVFCFGAHHKILSIYKAMRMKSIARWNRVAKHSFLTVMLIYVLFGVFCHFKSGSTEVTWFSQQHSNNLFTNMSKLFMCIKLLLTFPLDFIVGMTAWRRMVRRYHFHLRFTNTSLSGVRNWSPSVDVATNKLNGDGGLVDGRGTRILSVIEILDVSYCNQSNALGGDESNDYGRMSYNAGSLRNSVGVARNDNSKTINPTPSSSSSAVYSDPSSPSSKMVASSLSVTPRISAIVSEMRQADFSASSPSYHHLSSSIINSATGGNIYSSTSSSSSSSHQASPGTIREVMRTAGGSCDEDEGVSLTSDCKLSSVDVSSDSGYHTNRMSSGSAGSGLASSVSPSLEGRPINVSTDKAMSISDSIVNSLSFVQEDSSHAFDASSSFKNTTSRSHRLIINSNDSGGIRPARPVRHHQNRPQVSGGDSSVDIVSDISFRSSSIHQLTSTTSNYDIYDKTKEFVTALVMWILIVGLSCIGPVQAVAIIFASFFATGLIFILPSALYFRLGISDDFSATPVRGKVPNHWYMLFVQLFGIGLFLLNILTLGVVFARGDLQPLKPFDN